MPPPSKSERPVVGRVSNDRLEPATAARADHDVDVVLGARPDTETQAQEQA